MPERKAVLLDVGHTLIHPSRPVEDVLWQVLREEGYKDISMTDIRRGMVRGARFLSRVYGRDNSIWVSEEAVRRFWCQFYTLILSNAGLKETQIARIAPLVYDRFQEPDAWAVFPDVWPALEALRQKGLALGVISDWGAQLTELLHGLGLSKYLDFVVSSAVVGVAKPNPAVFYMALARGGLTPEEAVYIGDAYPLDVIG
ncbi:MAG: HAD-IA family hydrolase, partial [Chloroflexi bacterium]|nr:HAD-IA family hydrolase [Chloroflexota bacterium]